jgi:hypothetical protein
MVPASTNSSTPGVLPDPIQASFDSQESARNAIDRLLENGFTGEQLALVPASSSTLSPANDLGTYRTTGMEFSGSETDQDRAFFGGDPQSIEQHEVEADLISSHAALVSIAPMEGQQATAQSLLEELGGRILRRSSGRKLPRSAA